MSLMLIGTIIRSRGFHGEFVVDGIVRGMIPFQSADTVSIGYSKNFADKFILKSWKNDGNKAFVSVENILSDTDAQKLVNKGLFVEESMLKYEEDGLYAVDELISCKVFDINTGETIGELSDIYFTPANDVWIIKNETGELPIPVTDEVVKHVDIKNKKIEIVMIPGLEELFTPAKK